MDEETPALPVIIFVEAGKSWYISRLRPWFFTWLVRYSLAIPTLKVKKLILAGIDATSYDTSRKRRIKKKTPRSKMAKDAELIVKPDPHEN